MRTPSALRRLAQQDPVANVFILAHLRSGGYRRAHHAAARSVLGVFDDGVLVGACWAGANLVPVQLDPALAGVVAAAATAPAAATPPPSAPPTPVLALHAELEELGHAGPRGPRRTSL